MACRSRPSWIIPAHAVSQCRTNNIVAAYIFICMCGSIASKGKRVRGSGETTLHPVVRPFDPVLAALLRPRGRGSPVNRKPKKRIKNTVFLISH